MSARSAAMSPAPASAVDALRQAVAELHAAVELIARENDALRARHERAAAASGDGDAPMLLTVSQAADFIGAGKSTAWRMVQRGELPSVKFGGSRRIPRAWLERWVEALMETAAVEDQGELWARRVAAR